MNKENYILALIHNNNMCVDEAIEASIKARDKLIGKMARKDTKNFILKGNDKVFQTSKSLTELEKQFKAQGRAVYLYERQKICARACRLGLAQGRAVYLYERQKICMENWEGLGNNIPIYRVKSLLLAVFAREDEVRKILEVLRP